MRRDPAEHAVARAVGFQELSQRRACRRIVAVGRLRQQAGVLEIGIAAMQLVGALAGEHGFDIAPRAPRQQQLRRAVGVGGEGLGMPDGFLESSFEIGSGDRLGHMPQAEMPRGSGGCRAFGLGAAGKIDREGGDRVGGVGSPRLACEGGDGAGIDAAREKEPDRGVAMEALADRIGEQGLKFFRGFIEAARGRARCRRIEIGVALGHDAAARDQHIGPGLDGGDAGEESLLRQEHAAQTPIDGAKVEPSLAPGMGENGFHLGAEEEDAALLGDEERLHAEAIPSQHHPAVAPVEQGEGELALDAADEVRAVLQIEVEQDFGIAPGAEDGAGGLKLAPGALEGVDLAVEGDHDLAGDIRHWLAAAGGVHQ
jgi:hypothetical protein